MSQSSYVRAIQLALSKRGFDPGPIDGVMGPLTKAAIKSFQKKVGIEADGVAGPLTVAELDPFGVGGLTQYDNIPWFKESMKLLGVEEFSGSASNPAIDNRGALINVDYTKDEVPWCGLHVGYCMRRALPDEPLPQNPLGAREWLKFGKDVTPKLGAVLVFWRVLKTSWQGHVGFYCGEQGEDYKVLGGNQDDSVSVALYGKNKFLGARWPTTF